MCVFQLELWEQSLQALEAITLRCPNKVTPYVPNIVRLATQLSTFDPLYSYEDAHADADADMAKGKPNANAAEEGWGDDAGDEGWGDEGDAEMNGPCTHAAEAWAHSRCASLRRRSRSPPHHPFLHVSQLLPVLSLPWRCLH